MSNNERSDHWFLSRLGDETIARCNVTHNSLPENCQSIAELMDSLNSRGGSDQWLVSFLIREYDVEIALSRSDFLTKDDVFAKQFVFDVYKLARGKKQTVTNVQHLIQLVLHVPFQSLDAIVAAFNQVVILADLIIQKE